MNTKISKIEKIIQECTETQLKEFAAYITANYEIDDDILEKFLESKNKKSKKSSKSIESDEESEDEAPKKKVKSKKSSPKSTKSSPKKEEESDDEKKAPAKKSSPKKSLKERISAAKKSDKYYNASTGRQCGKTEQQVKKGLLVFYDDLHVCGKKDCEKLKAVLKELGHTSKDSSLKKESSSKKESKVEKKKKVESSDTEEDDSSPKKEKVVVAKKEKKVEKKKIETSDTEEEEVVVAKKIEKKDKVEKDKVVVKDMEFEKNDDDNFEHKETGFVIDPKTEKVFGKQNEDGDVMELTNEDINECVSKKSAHLKVPQSTINDKIVEFSSKKDDSFDLELSDMEV